eukprot:CAMPEP_0181109166 /NCGR_PEP_ID=MMETSP1071-20121207/18030_1 /TAXON_ID=35127 /ORGANISM="Thalassiosira sp., Strain NH16" /LENGTH=183 /DNA_ID=CAMNT_0023192841 /DNA_START=128 /DNA_END=679 /DNA_ORIENTATION=+
MGPSTLSLSPTVKSAAVTTTAVLVTGLLLHQRNAISTCYHRHRGLEGFLRLLWIGDFLPPNIRASMDQLDEVEERMSKSGDQLDHIEILVQRARLESVDGSTSPSCDMSRDEVRDKLFHQYPQLRTKIGVFSNKLDTLAASIDSIQSHSDEEVKRRKKQLSNTIVEFMSELDRTIASLNLEVR